MRLNGNVSSSTNSSITLSLWLTGVSGGTYTLVVQHPITYKNITSTLNSRNNWSGSASISGLKSGTTYKVFCYIDGYEDVYTEIECETGGGSGPGPGPGPDPEPDPGPDEDPIFDVQSSSTQITVSCLSPSVYVDVVYTLRDSNWNETESDSLFLNSPYYGKWTFRNLTPAQTYHLSAYCTDGWYPINKDTTVDLGSVSTEGLKVQPWDWKKANEGATVTQVKEADAALTNKDQTSKFHSDVWDAMISLTIKAIHQCNQYWDGTILSSGNTKMTLNKTLTAKRFNSLRLNISNCCSYRGVKFDNIPVVSPGDIVYASYFRTLMTNLNRAIKDINNA